jgi:GNAT superfamily N-acetyltransferase
MAFTPIDEEEIINEPVAEEAKPRFIPIEDDEFFGIVGEEEAPEPAPPLGASTPVETPKSRFTPISDDEFFGIDMPEEKPEGPSESVLRPFADPLLNIGAGINDVVKGFSDAFGADNAVSQNLAKNSEFYRDLLSAGAKQDSEEIGRIMQEAEGQGVLAEIGAGLKALSVAPVDLVSQGIGSLIPFIATAGVGKAVGLSKAGIAVLQGVQGGAVGGGIVKGEIYSAVKDQLINSGVDEAKAEKAAQEAQAYNGKNLDQILLGIGLGVAASTTGADSAIRSLISRKVGKQTAEQVSEQAIQEVLRTGFVRGALKDGTMEFVTEGLQGGQERLAANIAVGREGFDVEPMRGVVGQATLEGAIGSVLGGGAGGISARVAQRDAREVVALRDAQKAADEAKQNNAPASAAAVEEQVNQTIEETPDERVARLQREAQEGVGDIELEEEPSVSGLPPIETYEQVQAKQRDAQEKFRQYAEEQRTRGATEEQINEARQKQLQPALDKIESDWRSATESAATEWADSVDPFNLPQLPENLRLAEARIFGEKLLQRLAKNLGVTEDNTVTLNATTPDGRSGTVRISMSGDGEVRAVSQFGEGASRSEGFGFLDFVTEGFNAQTGETTLSRVEPIKLQQPFTPPVTPTPEAAVAPVEPTPTAGVAGTTASVPVMITRKMEADLLSRGLTQEQINAMTPQEANDMLAQPAPTAAPVEPVVPVAGAVELAVTEVAPEVAAIGKPPEQMTPEESRSSLVPTKLPPNVEIKFAEENGKFTAIAVSGNRQVGRLEAVTQKDNDKLLTTEAGSMIYVDPDFRRTGIASSLYAEIEKNTDKSFTRRGNQTPLGKALFSSAGKSWGHAAAIENAIDKNLPVSASAVDQYSIKLPDGYTQQGDLYVYQPTPEAAPAAVTPTPVTPTPVTPEVPTAVEAPALAPLRRVVKAEQTEEDVSGLVGQGLVELYKGQPVITQAGLEALPEAERPRLTPEARKIQIDTRTSEAAAEAISKNLRIGVDQVPFDVRMPAGWTIEGDIYIPPTVEAAPEAAPETLTQPKPVNVDATGKPILNWEKKKMGRDSWQEATYEFSNPALPVDKIKFTIEYAGQRTGGYMIKWDAFKDGKRVQIDFKEITIPKDASGFTYPSATTSTTAKELVVNAVSGVLSGGQYDLATLSTVRGASAFDALALIAKTTGEYSKLAQEILNAAKTDSEIMGSLTVTMFRRKRDSENKGRLKNRSYYSPSWRSIYMMDKDAGDARVVVHEVIHGLLVQKLPESLATQGVKGAKYKKALDDALKSKTTPEPLKDIIRGYILAADAMGASEMLWGEGPVKGKFSQTVYKSSKYLGVVGREATTKAQREGGRMFEIEGMTTVKRVLQYLKENGVTEVDVVRRGAKQYDVTVAQSDLDKIETPKEKRQKFGARGYDPDQGYLSWAVSESKPPIANRPDTVVEYGFEYGLGNLDEFLAEVFSSPKFQGILNDIQMENGRTVWQTIIDAIRKILGMSVKQGSVLDVISRSAIELARTPDVLLLDGKTAPAPAPQPEARESRRAIVTPQQDRDYLDAVERGDLDSASRVVEDVAKRAGDTIGNEMVNEDGSPKLYQHATTKDWTVYDVPRTEDIGWSGASGKAIWLAPFGSPVRSSKRAPEGGFIIKKLYAFAKNALEVNNSDDVANVRRMYGDMLPYFIGEEGLAKIKRDGWDAIKWNYDERESKTETPSPPEIIVFNPEQIKSAEPVTRDNQGNIIPPSQRFQQGEADIRYARTERDPEVQKAAQDLKAGTIDRDEYQRIVDMRMPIRKFEAVPTPANNEDMLRGLGERTIKRKDAAGNEVTIKKQDLVQAPESIAEGTVLESRLDIPAYENADVWVVSLHEPRPNINKGNAGPVVAYTPTSVLRNVEFGVTEKAAVGIAAGKPKSTIATMKGEYVPMTAEQAYELATTNKDQWVEIGMNPVRHSYFYDKDTQTPVESAEEVVQVGGMVLAKNPVFGKKEDYLYSLREAQPTVGMTTDAVRARLEALGFGVEGMIRIVEDPQAAFEGRTIIQDGKAVRIELNASALRDNAAIDRVLNHEFAEAANADGALNKLVERLTPKEKKEINDAITRLGYEENVRTTEEAARAIEALAAGWKGRGFFERAVARVEAWGSKLGLKLTRRAAEYIAARNLAEVNENVRKWHISDALANLNGARRVNFNGVQAVLIPPSQMREAYSIAAYHGTPHEIKGKFQLAKIGTGEGATVYGWGLYFAENISVALEYKNRLAREERYDGSEFDDKNPFHLAAGKLASGKMLDKTREQVIADLEDTADIYSDNIQRSNLLKKSAQILRENKEAKIERIGNLYNVDLDVTQDQLMDWDKPLSEQNPEVRKKLEPFLPPYLQKPFEQKTIRELMDEDPTIQYVYRYRVMEEMDKTSFLDMFRTLSKDEREFRAKQKVSEAFRNAGIIGIRYLDQGSRFAQPKRTGFGWLVDDYRGSSYFKTEEEAIKFAEEAQTRNYVIFDEDVISITGRNGQPVDIRESRREPAPTFTEESPEAKTLSNLKASMEKVDMASETKGGKPTTQKVSEIAANWMEQGGDERALQDAITENTNLSPTNAAKVAKVIAKQYGLQQQIAETGAVIAEIAPEAEGAPRKSSVTKLIEQTAGVRKPVVKLQVSESAALKKQIQLKAREARETRKARKEAAEDLAKSITDYVKANPIRGPINSRQAMSITKKALKLDVNNEAAVDRFEMYVERVIENANYDRDLADARALIKKAKTLSKSSTTQANVKTVLDLVAAIPPALLDNPFEFNLVVQRYLLGLAPVTAKKYAVMPDADVTRYLQSLEPKIKENQDTLNRARAQRILDKQASYAEEEGIPLDEAIAILNSEEFLTQKTISKLNDLTNLLTSMAQESQKDVNSYDDSGATAKQKELISYMRKVGLDSLSNEEKKRYIRFSNNLMANGATFGMEQFQSIALGQEAAIEASKDKRLSDKMAAWITPFFGDKAKETARKIADKTQSESDTLKNIFGREAVGAIRKLLGLNRLDLQQTKSTKAKAEIADETGEYYKGLKKKYGEDATGFEAKGYAGVAGYLIQREGDKTQEESIAYRRRLFEQNIVELRKSDIQDDLTEADLKERALSQLTGASNSEILSQLKALNPASYEQLMWWKDTMLPKWRPFLKEHDENFNNQANNYNNPDHLTISYRFREGQLLPKEIEEAYSRDPIGMRIKQAANSIKRKEHQSLPVSPKSGVIANIDINFGYNQYSALVDQVDRAYVAPAWEQVVAFTNSPEFEPIMGGRANAAFVRKMLTDIQVARGRQSMTDDEAQMVAGGVRLARKMATQAVLGGFTQPLRQVGDQLWKLVTTSGRWDLIKKNLLSIGDGAPLMDKFPIGRRGDAQAGTQYASTYSELSRRVEAAVTDRNWAKYRELMNKVGEFWMTPLRASDVWVAKVSWMTYYEAYLNKQGIKMESWQREAELVETDSVRKDAAAQAEFAVDFYGGASDPTKMASLSKQSNNGWKEFAKLTFLPLNSFALQQKNALISDMRDAFLRTGDRKAAIAGIAGTLGGMAIFHGTRIALIGGLVYPAGKALLMGVFGIDMDEPDEEEKQKQLEDGWRKFKASMYGNIVAGGAGQFIENGMIDAFNRTAYLWQANINPDELLDEDGEIMSFGKYEKEVSPLYRFRSYGSSEYTFGLVDVLTEQAERSFVATQQIMDPEEMERYTGNEQAYALFSTGVQWAYFFRLMDTDVTRIAVGLKRDMDKGVEEREKEIKAIRSGR